MSAPNAQFASESLRWAKYFFNRDTAQATGSTSWGGPPGMVTNWFTHPLRFALCKVGPDPRLHAGPFWTNGTPAGAGAFALHALEPTATEYDQYLRRIVNPLTGDWLITPGATYDEVTNVSALAWTNAPGPATTGCTLAYVVALVIKSTLVPDEFTSYAIAVAELDTPHVVTSYTTPAAAEVSRPNFPAGSLKFRFAHQP